MEVTIVADFPARIIETVIHVPYPGRNAQAYRQPWPSQYGLRITTADNVFVCKNGVWFLRFDGEKTTPFTHSVGLTYIQALIRGVYCPIHVQDLVKNPRVSRETQQQAMDSQAIRQLRSSILETREEMAEAEEWRDESRLDILRPRLSRLEGELSDSVDLRGRSRELSRAADKDRQRVANALKNTLAKIKVADQALHEHLLESLRDRSGWNPCYAPEVPRIWITH